AVGQRLYLSLSSTSAFRDPRQDTFTWTSSDPDVVAVDEHGRVAALAPGRATITAETGEVSNRATIEVIPQTIETVEITPSATQARQGDVIRFEVVARDGQG